MIAGIDLLVSDIDGTLVRTDKTLSQTTVEAFGRLRAAGIRTTLISARPPSGMMALAETLGLDGPLGAFNGGTLFYKDGRIETAERLPASVAAGVLDRLETAGVHVWVFAQGLWYARTLDNPRVPHERRAAGVEPTLVGAFQGLGPVDKIVGVSEDFAGLEALEAAVKSATGDDATVVRSQPYLLDITAPAANKGDGIEAIARAFGAPLTRVAAIGDMANDLPMFARAGLSIAMGQASESVRDAADRVTTSNDEDGVAKAIDRFILVSETT